MKCIYLSPSVQQFNEYNGGGNEEQYMNLVADSVARELEQYGICFDRNSPSMSVNEIIEMSNNGDYLLHLAIHSNAAGEGQSGEVTGSEVYYYPTSEKGSLLAHIIADNLKSIYPNPNLVTTKTSTSFAELRKTKAPSVLVEVAYHDNVDDANWIRENVDEIGKSLALSVKEYIDETTSCPIGNFGEVVTMGGRLNMRAEANINSPVVQSIPNSSRVEIIDCSGRWYKVRYNLLEGYVFKSYVAAY